MASHFLIKISRQMLILALLFLCACLNQINAQTNSALPPRQLSEFEKEPLDPCWRVQLKLFNVSANTHHDETITAKARLGTRDTSPNLNKRRLHNVLIYWTNHPQKEANRSAETINFVEGEPVNSRYGQIEFYVSGQLVEVIKISGNMDLRTEDCYAGVDGAKVMPCVRKIDKLSYPCVDYKWRKRKNVRLKRNK